MPSWFEWDEEVQAAALAGARKAFPALAGVAELVDLEQDALIYIATHVETVERRLGKDRDLHYVTMQVSGYLWDRYEVTKKGRDVTGPLEWMAVDQ